MHSLFQSVLFNGFICGENRNDEALAAGEGVHLDLGICHVGEYFPLCFVKADTLSKPKENKCVFYHILCYTNGNSVIRSFAHPYGYNSIVSSSPMGNVDSGIFAHTVSYLRSSPQGIGVTLALIVIGGCCDENGMASIVCVTTSKVTSLYP